MENSTRALKMAFAVIVFVIAISISFMLFGRLKNTLDYVMLYSNNEQAFYTLNDYSNEVFSLTNRRMVGLDTVISNISNYYNLGYYIYLQKGNYNEQTGEINSIQDIHVYTNSNIGNVNYFNIDEEIKRNEPWTSSNEDINNHTKILLYGGTYNGIRYDGIINTAFNRKY